MNKGDLVFFNWHMQLIEEDRLGLILEDLGPFLKLYTRDCNQTSTEIMVPKGDVETLKSRIQSNPFHKLTFRLGYLISRLRGEFVSGKSVSNELERLFAHDVKVDYNKAYDNDKSDNLVELTHRDIPFFNPVKLFSVFSGRGKEKPFEMLRANSALPQKQDTSKILKYTKYDSWKSYEQGSSVNELLNKTNNLFSIIPTAGGKSLIYQLITKFNSKNNKGMTWVLAPTISLIRDQVQQLNQEESGIVLKSSYLDSLLDENEIEEEKSRIRSGIVDIVYTTPKMAINTDILYLMGQSMNRSIDLLVIDEAHLISDWGLSFYPEYRRIDHVRQHILDTNSDLKTLLLSATVTKKTKEDVISRVFHKEDTEIIDSNRTRDDIDLNVKNFSNSQYGSSYRFDALIDEVKKHLDKGEQGIVYCLTKKGSNLRSCEEVYSELKNNYSVEIYSADQGSLARSQISEDFYSGKTQLVIATKAFGLGINKPDIRFVFHIGFPKNLDSLYQEFSRGGRDGKGCTATLFSHNSDFEIHRSNIQKEISGSGKAKERLEVMLLGEGKKFSSEIGLSMEEMLGDDNYILLDTWNTPKRHNNANEISSRRSHIENNVKLLSFLEEFGWIKIIYDASSRFKVTTEYGEPAPFPHHYLAQGKEDYRNYVKIKLYDDQTLIDISSIYLESKNFVDLEKEIIRICKENNYVLEIQGGLKVVIPTNKFPTDLKFDRVYNLQRQKLIDSKLDDLEKVKDYTNNIDQCRRMIFKKIYGFEDTFSADKNCRCDICLLN